MSRTTLRSSILRLALAAAVSVAFVGSAHALQGPLTGELSVQNDRYAPVTIYVDGQRRAELGPGQTKVLRAIPNGVRLVTTQGRRGAEVTERVTVRINKRVAYRVAPRRGVALIKNKSGVDLRVAINGKPSGVLRRGDQLETKPMRPGAHTLTATPIGQGSFATPPVRVGFDVVAGEARKVRIKPFFASLRVTNPFPYRVRVSVNGQPATRLRAHQSIVLDNQLPGRVNVTFSRHGRTLDTAVVRLVPGTLSEISPQIAYVGDLEIRNLSGLPFRLRINGERKGRLAPGKTLVLRDMDAGQVTVVARTSQGRTIERTAQVRPNRRATVDLTNNMPVIAHY